MQSNVINENNSLNRLKMAYSSIGRTVVYETSDPGSNPDRPT